MIYHVPPPPFIFFDKDRWDSWTPPNTEICSYCGMQHVIAEASELRSHEPPSVYRARDDASCSMVCQCSLFNPVQEPKAIYAREVYCSRACFMKSGHRSTARHQVFQDVWSVPNLYGFPDDIISRTLRFWSHDAKGVYAGDGVRVFDTPVPERPQYDPYAPLDGFGIPQHGGIRPDLPDVPNVVPPTMWTWNEYQWRLVHSISLSSI